jgi:hypothetical protein
MVVYATGDRTEIKARIKTLETQAKRLRGRAREEVLQVIEELRQVLQ